MKKKINRRSQTARNKKLRLNYKKLRQAGFSSKEATKYRSRSDASIQHIISYRSKKTKNDIINAKRRENYRKLREAGYSSKEASKHRKMSDENIQKLIALKKLNLPTQYIDILTEWDHQIIDFLLSHQEFLSPEELMNMIDLSNDGKGVDLISFIDRVKNMLENKGIDFTKIEDEWFENILEVYGYV